MLYSPVSRTLPNGQRRNKRYQTMNTWRVFKKEDDEVGVLKAYINHPNIEKGFIEFEFKSTLDSACRKTAEEHVCTDVQKKMAADILDGVDFHDKRAVIKVMNNKMISLPALWSWMSKFRRDELYDINGAIHHKDAMWRIFTCLNDTTKMRLIVDSYLLQFDLKNVMFLGQGSLHATGRLARWAVWTNKTNKEMQLSANFGRLIELIQEHLEEDGLTEHDLQEMNQLIQELRQWFSKNKEPIKQKFIQKIQMMTIDLQDMEREMFDPMYAQTMCLLFLKGQMPKMQDAMDFACSLMPIEDQMVAMFARKNIKAYFHHDVAFEDLRSTVSTNLREWVNDNIQRGYRSVRFGSKDRFRIEGFYENQKENIKKMADLSGLSVDTSTLDRMIKTIEYHGNTDAKTADRVFETTQDIMAIAGLRFNRTQSSTRFDMPMQIDSNRVDEILDNLKKAAKKIQEQRDERKPRQSAKTIIWDRKGQQMEIELTGARRHDMPIGGYIANLEGKTYPLLWMENQLKAVAVQSY